MRILVTNDDGIHAPGLKIAEAIARALSDDVWVFAPETDQSGVAHSLSLNDPLRLRQVSERHFAVKGTPTDCVIMALRHSLADKRPDLVLSGVNKGQNVAEDVTYSGTVAGAIEGTILGVRSIALSQAYGADRQSPLHWDCAQELAPAIIRTLLEKGFDADTLININFPSLPPQKVKGPMLTVQGRRDRDMLKIDPRHDGRGNPYFWIAFNRTPHEPETGSDLWALANGHVSVTPLKINYTDHPALTELAAAFPHGA